MNWDLRKAERARARGDRDEARVYAWNALASISPEDLPSLLRLAQELDDKLLVLEIERRGVTGEVGPTPLSRTGTVFRASILAVLATAVVVTEKL
jgi:hypothetical protein